MPVPSPCIQHCVLDPKTDVCQGCFRTRGEIATWLMQSDAERLATVARCERRKGQSP